MVKRILYILVFAPLLLPGKVLGDMTSTNYTIYSDAIGVSGDFSVSPSYTLSDTIGETPVVYSSSTTYTVRAGYQATTRGVLSLKVSTSSIGLGTLSLSAVNTASTSLTVSSDSAGYTLSISNVSGIMPAAVSDGTVSAGTEEYGISVSGTNSLVSADVAVVNGLLLASSPDPVTGDEVVLTFKAAAGSGSTAQTYSQSLDITVMADL